MIVRIVFGLVTVLCLVFLPKGEKIFSLIPFFLYYISRLADGGGRETFGEYSLPLIFILGIICVTYFLIKEYYVWLYVLATPICAGYTYYAYTNYAGVINLQWPLLITALAMILALFLTAKAGVFGKIVLNCCLIVVIGLSMSASLPAFTHNEARELVSAELGKPVYPTNIEPYTDEVSISPLPLTWVDCFYVFESEEDGIPYIFNPENGDWSELEPTEP